MEATVLTFVMQDLTAKLQAGEELDQQDIRLATEALLDENVDHHEKADFLTALSNRGESVEEIAGFADEFLKRAVDPKIDPQKVVFPVLDVCGTGGDKLDLFNVSTTAVFVLAGAGVAVVKHGNRGITSKSGGADVLEALGIDIELPPEHFERCVSEVGAGFLFAPRYHPAFKAVAPVRKLLAERGQRTMFNLLGPLLNPARPDFQLIGVFDSRVGKDFAGILARLGRKKAWAVHGKTESGAGMDELSTLGENQIWSTDPEDPVDSLFHPDQFQFAEASIEDLKGGDASENAEILKNILSGKLVGAKRDLVVLNAAAGLVVTGRVASIPEGIALANETIDSGAAEKILRDWQVFC